jgi:hypothetical protein
VIGVDEVQADGLVADQDLAGAGRGDGQVDGLEHLGAAGADGLYGQHDGQPRLDLKKARLRALALPASAAS